MHRRSRAGHRPVRDGVGEAGFRVAHHFNPAHSDLGAATLVETVVHMTIRPLAITGLATTIAIVPASAQQASSTATLTVPHTMFKLPNGLTVILHEDHSVPKVAVNVWYHVGSAREKPGRTGFAHLFEHLLFEGSKNVKEGEFDTLARGRRRQQQRIDDDGSHELLRDDAVERARSRAVPRIGSHGLPARRRHAEARRRPARRRQERAPSELRERTVRHGAASA